MQPEQEVLSREFEFPGDAASIAPARDAIVQFVHEHCADEQQETDIFLALQEALANAMVHGCQGDPSKRVHCTVEITPSSFSFVIRDPGQGFDTGNPADAAEDGTNLTEHGRGIYLMRSLMDKVSYRHKGSELRLKKFRAGVTAR